MKKLLRETFGETGDISCTRVMAMIALFAAIGLAFTGHDASAAVFIGTAFAGKVSQRFVETRETTVSEDKGPRL